MSQNKVIKIRLALMGRPMKSFTFDKDVITVGRDPDADIFLDNPGISREHVRFERQARGDYLLVDLGSANGTFLNDDRAQKAVVRDQDVVRIGKFSLWIGFAEDRRTPGAEQRRISPDTYQATMVLSSSELGEMMSSARQRESLTTPAASTTTAPSAAPPVPGPRNAPAPRVQASNVLAVLIALLAGTALGAGATILLLTR